LRNMLSLLTVFTYFLSIVHLIVSHSSENRYSEFDVLFKHPGREMIRVLHRKEFCSEIDESND
ncbi:MAG: hypothetical protein V7L23_13110, partial [Nostoc sp.]